METLISRSEMIAYRSNVLQALEELKLKRCEIIDRQKAAEKMLAEKLIAEQNFEATSQRLKQAEHTISTLRDKLNDAASKALESKYKNENVQLKVALEAAESTVITLKKEIGMISIQRHQLEVSLKQSEQKAASRDSQVNGLSERIQCLEKAAATISKQLVEYEETQVLLHRNIDSALSMNGDLVRARAHTEFVLDDTRKEVEILKRKLIESEARCRWSQDSTYSSQLEQNLQDEAVKLKKTIELLERKNQDDMKSNEQLSSDLKDAQEALDRTRKIIASSSSDDKSVIELENQLKESDEKARAAELQLNSISKDIEKIKMEKEKEVSRAAEEIETLNCQLQETTQTASGLQLKVHDLKEAKLTIQELKIQLDSLGKKYQSQCIELEESERKIAEYDADAKKNQFVLPQTVDCWCQTESKQIVFLEQECQTDDVGYVADKLENANQASLSEETIPTNDTVKGSDNVCSINDDIAVLVNAKIIDWSSITAEKAVVECSIATFSDIHHINACEPDSFQEKVSDIPSTPPEIMSKQTDSRSHIDADSPSTRMNDTTKSLRSEEFIAVDCSDLHGEDIISSSSQEELSLSAKEKHVIKFKTPFVEKSSRNIGLIKDSSVKESSLGKAKTDKSALPVETCDSEIRPRVLARKRKLASSPPMLDLSQPSTTDMSHSLESSVKQAPLRSLKNFTKQVMANKSAVKPRVRFKPLSLLSGPSGSFNFSSKLSNISPLPALQGLHHGAKPSMLKGALSSQHVQSLPCDVEICSDVEIDEYD